MAENKDDLSDLPTLARDRSLARQNLKLNGAAARERLKPSNLISEVKDKAAARIRKTGESAIEGVRAHPGITATVAATATLIAMRRPLARLVASRQKTGPDSTEE